MAAIDQATEERIAQARSKQKQLKNPSLLIRDDGMLYPNTEKMQKNPRYRPYYGDPKASLDERMRFLQGLGSKRQVVFSEPQEPFDIGKADVDALVSFAIEQYGVALDPAKPIATLRQKVFDLAQADAQPADDSTKLHSTLPKPQGMGGAPFDA